MATHSSVLAWRIPGTAEPGGLPSMGLHRVRHDWSDLAVAAATTKSGNWWWTGRPGVLRFMGTQRVGHDWATELNWTTKLSLPEEAFRQSTFTHLSFKENASQLQRMSHPRFWMNQRETMTAYRIKAQGTTSPFVFVVITSSLVHDRIDSVLTTAFNTKDSIKE